MAKEAAGGLCDADAGYCSRMLRTDSRRGVKWVYANLTILRHATTLTPHLSCKPWADLAPICRKKEESCGHDSVKIMVDIYGHLMPGFNEEAVNRPPRNGNHRDNTTAKRRRAPMSEQSVKIYTANG
jgi:hypothetical protein